MWHMCDRRFWWGNLKAVPGIPGHRCEGDVKMCIKGIGWRGLEWINQA